jgi:protein-L-isoaspartate O-methyltransferase
MTKIRSLDTFLFTYRCFGESPMKTSRRDSMLAFYQQTLLNPGEISLETDQAWRTQVAKRVNLYQNHLHIPLAFLRDRSVLEFGCASGENALVLADAGANLTLVEPNELLHPRLRDLFARFGLHNRLVRLCSDGVGEFQSPTPYDLVLAEGFLFALPNRDAMVAKLAGLLARGGFGVISFNDRYGMLIEATKRLIWRRACDLAGVSDLGGEQSLEVARSLYGESYAKSNASRAFYTWWKDNLVSPFLTSPYLWSFPELLPIVEAAGCEFYASSPQWTSLDRFSWYKNVLDTQTRHAQLIELDWHDAFGYFLTGCPSNEKSSRPTAEVVASVAHLMSAISEYTENGLFLAAVEYPQALNDFFSQSTDERYRQFNADMKQLYRCLATDALSTLISTYQGLECLPELWGAPYHYLCFKRSMA